MRFKDVFSIIGPAMIGPSSSHTAGAIRLGRVARCLFGSRPEHADITFYGSFADTYQGHGTDLAIVGGLLDYDTDDPRIPTSLDGAEEEGMDVTFRTSRTPAPHPNTARMNLKGGGRELTVTGASIGGGNIEISSINSFDVKFTGMYPTLVLSHEDRPGMIADITAILRIWNMNIGYMDLDRKSRNGEAMTVIEVDSPISGKLAEQIRSIGGMQEVGVVDLREGES
ncbi:L-serine dehydratase, iron-sulfur-dependent subunit beta [Paenibacillus sp. J31TS4]|uniref:L-serine ammonia-lyase, iron-sulfur-dependent subunit beta n=1 Tax=Paenibacillus sp. J31TS4 TaxID=2807195 RepID=UPI001B24BED5|nr:L-serine ammonia-lyase, iron-sulfur-dependent subunit beta [Paenibacillus sp. J31TS4]GIP37270.1 L-serine dehydratase, iron-sulfur-dependent subunit beta [Paenibacillus sp. J31TS4]